MNENKPIEDHLRNENTRLRRELADKDQQIAELASFGDVMRTVALLPLDTEVKRTKFSERVKVALLVHGITPDMGGTAIRDGIVNMLAVDRERLVRLGLAAGKHRQSESGMAVTPGCDCTVCSMITAAETIERIESTRGEGSRSDRGPGQAKSDRLAGGDYFLTKDLVEKTNITDRAQVDLTVKSLTSMLTKLGFARHGSASDMLSLLTELLSGRLGRSRGRGFPTGFGDSPDVIAAFEIGPDGDLRALDPSE